MRQTQSLLTSACKVLLGYAVALAAVGLVTLVIDFVIGQAILANIAMLYLAAVLVTAVAFGRGPAILASVTSFLAFNFFFTGPHYTFTVDDPDVWLALLFYLGTAIVTGQLAADQRRRAQEARQGEHEALFVNEVVHLISQPDLEQALDAVAERLRQELQLSAVSISCPSNGGLGGMRGAAGEPEIVRQTRRAVATPAYVLQKGPVPSSLHPVWSGRWIKVSPLWLPNLLRRTTDSRPYLVQLTSGDLQVGTMALASPPHGPGFSTTDNRLLSAVAEQLGHAIGRARLRREVTSAEVLRRADELKTALLNAVSHDLRTPLASIIASASSLRQRDVAWTAEDREEFAKTIEQEALRLNRIVGNLLDLSRLEAGSLRPEKGWYDIGALVNDVLGRMKATTSKHHVVVDIAEDLPPVQFDYTEIDQVLSNLIENAVKYTPPETEILVSARPTGEDVQVEVADRGPGVPATALPYLFTPFYRIDRAERQGPRPGGTGLGLAVVKGLVEAHGGQVWAGNRQGGGARFAFTLPLALAGEEVASEVGKKSVYEPIIGDPNPGGR
jgi:two-component system, OmpR family, sensor histidine kinase KdpD